MTIGEYYELKIAREVDFGVYLESDLGDILLPIKYLGEDYKVDDFIKVFLYKDSEDRLIATTLEPYGKLNDFVKLTATDTTSHGAFMDWGLEKDLFVPRSEQHTPFEVGESYVVRICYDYKTERLVGVGKLRPFFDENTDELRGGEEVDLLIYDKTDLGFMAIVNQRHSGLIYENEVFEKINIGDQKKGFIKLIREDGKLDLRLKPSGSAGIANDASKLLEHLAANDGYIPFTDSSDPEAIKAELQMSKKSFKRAIGSLYRDKKITLETEGIRLV